MPELAGVIRLVRNPDASLASSRLSIWKLPGRKVVIHDGTRLQIACYGTALQMGATLASNLADGDAFAFLLPAEADLPGRWSSVLQFLTLLDSALMQRRAASYPYPSRQSLVHMRTLQALDGASAGASHRDIATTLFGQRDACSRWHADGDLRAQVRHLLRRGRALVEGGYRRLLHDRLTNKGHSPTRAKSP